MEPAVIQIERIAREVIEQSTRAGQSGAGPDEIGRLVDEVLARISAPATVLKLESRVVTHSDIANKLEGIQQIILPQRAVITPAARDELRLRDIAISYAIESRGAAKPLRAVVWGQAESDYNAARLIDALNREGITIEQIAQTGLVQVTHEINDEVAKGGKPAVLLTAKAAAAVCLANRRPGVRAVPAQSVATTMQAVWAVGANLLVVDPARVGWFELKRLVAQFIAGAPYPCPAEYREQLG